MDIRKIIGNNVLNARKIRNLSQEQFAEMIGIEPSALSKIENGKSYPSQQTLENIICALKIKPDVLFKTEEKIDIEKAYKELLVQLEQIKQNEELFTKVYYKIQELTSNI
ncbi:MAG: helix-turn-helix transcriptional regulator [Acinetobacter sp.]|jgi:transcriptional regulator, XRE family|nr:helix-turn-helix transcriptional regulator [Acinetobacter sp.]DAB01496.1 MAG TPA: hypothetical protein CPT96_04490 [Candidatus Gastranaerophilales bacterium HUM_10]DAB11102.1 MAG TPA: hypothetical protein CPT91_06925 [Candidatus Gastranaerophilales bacterium HUM_16]